MFGKKDLAKAIERSSKLDDLSGGAKIAICVPTNGMVHSKFMYCLINAIKYIESLNFQIHLLMDMGTVLSNQRQQLAFDALEIGADYIMWFDSDMTFPENIIHTLIQHNKDVICATYSKRVPPFHATAFYSIDPLEPVTLKTGLSRVYSTGMGCMLVDTKIFNYLSTPWFPLLWHDETQSWLGEDMGFCDLLTKEGISIWCDLDLSQDVGHLGQKEFLLSQANS